MLNTSSMPKNVVAANAKNKTTIIILSIKRLLYDSSRNSLSFPGNDPLHKAKWKSNSSYQGYSIGVLHWGISSYLGLFLSN